MLFLDDSLLKMKNFETQLSPYDIIFLCVYNTFKHLNGENVTDKSET